MHRCPQSGTWENYLSTRPVSDPEDALDLEEARSFGLSETSLVIYAENPDECIAEEASSLPNGKVVVSIVGKFNDESGAANGFHSTVFGKNGGSGAGGSDTTRGAATGLGENSAATAHTDAGHLLYYASWRNRNFVVSMDAFNMAETNARQIAININARIS